jgi:hypothetical protein
VKTHEHHPQGVVGEGFLIHRLLLRACSTPARLFMRDAVLFLLPALLAPQVIQREIPRRLRQPRRRIVRHAAIGPCLQGADQGLLHHVLRQLQAVRAQPACEHGHQTCALAAK